jgi:hypothetical protein
MGYIKTLVQINRYHYYELRRIGLSCLLLFPLSAVPPHLSCFGPSRISLKMTAFWDIAPCGLAEVGDVSEVCTASIIRTVSSSYSLP